MSQLLVVFGATGNQGGSVAKFVIKDPELSKIYKVRGVTRDTTKPAAQELQKLGIEVVKGDQDDKASLSAVMKGAHTVFAVTATVYDDKLYEREYEQGRAMVDAAVAAGVKYFIFSTLSGIKEGSGGKLTGGGHFDVKYDIEKYIRSKPQIKSAFFAPAGFMQNFQHTMGPRPSQNGDGTYAISNFVSPTTHFPLIDIDETGKYVGAILAQPEEYSGKVLSAATHSITYNEIVETMTKVSGKTVKYNQLPKEVYAGFLPENNRGYLVDMFEWIQDYGYYGKGTEEKVEWTAKQARGDLTTLEEWLKENPLHLA